MGNKLIYIPSPDERSCGASVVAMALSYFGENVPMDELVRELGIPEAGYTRKIALRRVFERRGFRFCEENNSNITTLGIMATGGKPLIINWSPQPGCGQYSIVKECTDDLLITNDPHKGEDYPIPIETFYSRWVSGNRKWNKWLMQVLGPKERA